MLGRGGWVRNWWVSMALSQDPPPLGDREGALGGGDDDDEAAALSGEAVAACGKNHPSLRKVAPDRL